MKDLLTNEEIDTLLEAFRAEGVGGDASQDALRAGGGRSGGEVRRVDLLKPNRFSREQIRSLELVFETAAKSLAVTMSDKLRIDMVCDCVAVEQMRLQQWFRVLTGPSAIYVLNMQPFPMPVLFTVTTGLLYGAVDRILGGSGKLSDAREDFTLAEYIVADAFVAPCLDKICEGLEDLGEFKWEIQDRFCNPTMAQILPSQDVLLSVHFQVSSEHMRGDMRIAIPFAAIESFLPGIEFGPGSTYRMPPGSMRDTTAKVLEKVSVNMSVRLGETEVPLRQLMELAVGDVVTLPTRVGESLVAPVEGKPKFMGQVGKQGSHLAFQVSSVVES